ncbi:MAG: class II aldolase/adducin family protein, partial [Anaerolineae bacterium]|nr:class II aldolase/adducin family protein [Anaerolineae bacterium]
VENGDLWITPAGIDKGKLTPKDIVCVHPDGSMDGAHRPSSEYPFHRAIYACRPDFNAIVHAHPPALVSFSAARRIPETNIIPQANRICGSVGYAPYALPGSEALGDNIAMTFAEGCNLVLLENHGIVTGGADILEAFQRLETLDFCARTLIQAQSLGQTIHLNDEQLAPFDHATHLLPEFGPQAYSSRERELRQQIVEIVHRACDRSLMISTEGVVSARIDDGCFLITPTGLDRRGLDVEDIVRIQNGQREAGKVPSRSVRLHQSIYTQHPGIHCIMTAQCPGVAAFAITSAIFDTRTIPESYILLRDIPEIPYGTQYQQPEAIATMLSEDTPVLLIQNDCILTTGTNVLEAFDRLEVAEFSARALIDVSKIGQLVPIGQDEIYQLEKRFLRK